MKLKLKRVYKIISSNKLLNYFIIYTILFIITSFFVFLSFITANKSFIWHYDGIWQHYPILSYIGSYIRQIIKSTFDTYIQIPMVDFNIGMGMDILTTLNYYGLGDPLYLLSIFFKPPQIEYVYNFIIIFKLYLAGLSFSLYCIYMKKDYFNIFFGSLIYIFSGFLLNMGIRHSIFITPLIYLPLLLIGLEELLKHKKSIFFVFMVFVSALSNFYFFYMMTLLMSIYVFIRFFDIYKVKKLKSFIHITFKCIYLYLLGLSMAVFIFLPIVLAFVNNSKVAVSDREVQFLNLNKDFYIQFILYFISPSKNLTLETIENYVPLSLIAIVLLFSIKKSEKYKSLKVGFVLLTLFLIVPFFGYIFNGFSYVSNRWIFGYNFLIAYIVVIMLPHIYKINFKGVVLILGVIILFISLCLFYNNAQNIYVFAGVIMLLFTFILILISNNYISKTKLKSNLIILEAVLFSIFVNSIFRYNPKLGNYVNQFIDSNKARVNILDSPVSIIDKINDTNFYRIGVYGNSNVNASLIQGYNGISAYYSLMDSIYLDYFINLECIGNRYSCYFKDFNNRTFVDTLSSIKYYVTEKSKKQRLFYGYKKVLEGKREISDKEIYDEVYENTYALPLGYTYKSYITEDEFNNLNSLQKQESMLQAIVLSDNDKLNSDWGGGIL